MFEYNSQLVSVSRKYSGFRRTSPENFRGERTLSEIFRIQADVAGKKIRIPDKKNRLRMNGSAAFFFDVIISQK